ncbi:MAG: alpha/beta hydrolase [Actinomycetota bacterium]|nr:alpha/beta hydrolase [Actinomycetota bacterium]
MLGFVLVAMSLLGCAGGRESGPTTAETVTAGGSTVLVWGEGESGVVLAHGASYDAASWEEQARAMEDQELAVAAVEDLSAGAVADAAGFLRAERRSTRVTLVGSSVGAAPVLEAAASDPAIADAVVLLSPAGGDLAALASVPVLVLYSEDESYVDGIESMVADAAEVDVETRPLPGDRHGQGIFNGDQAEVVVDAITEVASQ